MCSIETTEKTKCGGEVETGKVRLRRKDQVRVMDPITHHKKDLLKSLGRRLLDRRYNLSLRVDRIGSSRRC